MKKAISFLTMLILLLCIASSGTAEKPVRTEGIDIPVFTDMKKFDLPDTDAMAFSGNLRAGWNLGNTFDAYNGTKFIPGTSTETSWVGVRTSTELIDTIFEAGFNLIRIPVSWHNHVDENWQIDAEWMARVEEVVRYALGKGMYVILNIHHDNDIRFFYPLKQYLESSKNYLSSIWKQIGEHFADCDEHLILESMNEPRLVGDVNLEWTWSPTNTTSLEALDCINQFNQLFVDTIRSCGGQNTSRYLLIPGYAGNPYSVCSDQFVIPQDPTPDHIMIEVHAYTPYSFALSEDMNDSHFDLDHDKSAIGSFMNDLYKKFISNGIPVIIDEFGARDKNGNLQDRVNFAAYYIVSASARGIPCCWWDNHCFDGNGERFGIIDRKSCTWVYPDIALAILSNCDYNR